MASFPNALASFSGFTSSHTLATDNHAAQHNLEQGEILAVQTKVGTGSSTPTSGTLLHGTANGVSAWAQVALTTDVTGILPIANGGNGTASISGSGLPVFASSPSLDGGGIWNGSPTLVAPLITSFVSSNHDHSNAANGGTLPAAAVPNLSLSAQTLSNPYKFSAYSTSIHTYGTANTKMTFEDEEFDTNNNFDLSTNTYTVPVTGSYMFISSVQIGNASTADTITAHLYVNGASTKILSKNGDPVTNTVQNGSALITVLAGDTVNVYIGSSGHSVATSGNETTDFFMGYLVSQT